MTEKEYKAAFKKNLIHFENDKIRDITIRYHQYQHKLEVSFETYVYKEICFDISKLDSFMNIIHYDKRPDNADTFWYLWHAKDKYLRLIVYDTPDEEMHQLADAHNIVGIMNIVHDNSYLLF